MREKTRWAYLMPHGVVGAAQRQKIPLMVSAGSPDMSYVMRVAWWAFKARATAHGSYLSEYIHEGIVIGARP